jgi:hypothetical protein
MSDTVERAARLISRRVPRAAQRISTRYNAAVDMARTLADAGLLLSDADRAVLDAVRTYFDIVQQGTGQPSFDPAVADARLGVLAAERARREVAS